MPSYKIRAEAFEAANSLVAGWQERNKYDFVDEWVKKINTENDDEDED